MVMAMAMAMVDDGNGGGDARRPSDMGLKRQAAGRAMTGGDESGPRRLRACRKSEARSVFVINDTIAPDSATRFVGQRDHAIDDK